MEQTKRKIPRVCKYCNQKLYGVQCRENFCNDACRDHFSTNNGGRLSYSRRYSCDCDNCGKLFSTHNCGGTRFCSDECRRAKTPK